MADERTLDREAAAAPTIETLLDRLARIAELGEPIDPGTVVSDAPVDSLSLLEWMYDLEDEFEFVLPDDVYENVGQRTFASLYAVVLDNRGTAPR